MFKNLVSSEASVYFSSVEFTFNAKCSYFTHISFVFAGIHFKWYKKMWSFNSESLLISAKLNFSSSFAGKKAQKRFYWTAVNALFRAPPIANGTIAHWNWIMRECRKKRPIAINDERASVRNYDMQTMQNKRIPFKRN